MSTSDEISWTEVSFEVNSSSGIYEDPEVDLASVVVGATTKENEIKDRIKQYLNIFRNSTDQKDVKEEAKNLLLHFFTKYNNKKALKKYLQDIVGKSNLTSLIIKTTTEEILENINNTRCNLNLCTDLLNFVNVMQNSIEYDYEMTIEYLFPLYYKLFEGFVYHSKSTFEKVSSILDELISVVNVVLKQILAVFGKDIPFIETLSKMYSAKLIVLAHTVVNHEEIGFDLKTKAGLIFTHSFNIIPQKYRKNFKYEDCPQLAFLSEYNEEKFFTLIKNKLPVFEHGDSIVITYASILNVLPQEKLFELTINGKTLVCSLYQGLMNCARRESSNPHIIVETSRALTTIGKQLKFLPRDLVKPLYLEGIAFVWSHIEHFVDSVRNYTKLFFVELVIVAATHRNEGHVELADILIENVKQLETTQTVRFLAMENISLNMGCTYLLQNFNDLPDDLLNVISNPTISEQVSKTYIVIMEKHFRESNREEWTSVWVSPVTGVLKSCAHCTPLCQRIISHAFQLYPPVLRKIYPHNYIGNTQESGVLLKCLEFARLNGMELTIESREEVPLYWRGLIDKDKMQAFMTHQDDGVRVSALAAIVVSQKSTEIFLDWELAYLTSYISYNITSQIPSVRKQILTYYKKALARFNAGFNVIVRNISYLKKKLELPEDIRRETISIFAVYQELYSSYKSFIKKFTKLLISFLTIDSNYPRRALSMELLILIHSFLPLDEWLLCWTEEDVKNCHSILFDGYESNKKMAVILLKDLPPKDMGFTDVDFTFKYMQRCLSIALGIKPNTTLSAPYLLEVCAYSPFFYEIVQYGDSRSKKRTLHNPILDTVVILVEKLIGQINILMDNCTPKVANYGLLMCIRYLLQRRDMSKDNEACSGLFEHITTICLNLKNHVMPIVCNPTPEGYLPETGDMIYIDDTSKSQLLVVYAWRTIKEMTLLLAEIVRQTIKLEKTLEMLGMSLIIKVGQFFLDIFLETKHRGVYEQAYISFSVICDSFWTSSNPKFNCLPKLWLQDALRLCTGEKQSSKLCVTRRSAGLPFLILAILGSEPTFSKPRFNHAITVLLEKCKNINHGNNEYRVHCLNVLRAMFRHSRLGEMVSPFIAQGVIIAILGFNSETWGIRNSATLLYAALITRMFGVQRTQDSEDVCMKNRLTVRVFFMRYPELFKFLMSTLARESIKSDSLLLHPVLMILCRLYPGHFEEYDMQLDRYLPHLTVCLSNPVYRTRELAARASILLIRNDQMEEHLDHTFERLKEPDIKDNECHGLLLQVYHILKSSNIGEIHLTRYLANSVHLLQYVGKKFSHMTVSLYMEVVMLFLMKYRSYDDLEMLKTIVQILSRQITSNQVALTAKSKYPQRRLELLLYIIVNKFEETDLTYPTVTNQLICQLYGHNFEMKRFCLQLLIYLNQIQHDFKHALYETEEFQMPQEIVTLVNSFEKPLVTKMLTSMHQYLKGFLTEEVKYPHYIKSEDRVLLFLLVNYYPCVIKYLNLSKQETLNSLITFCNCDNEELISAVVSCISTFLLQLDYSVLRYDQLLKVLVESASPAASDFRRLAVCDFLWKNYILYCNEDPILVGDELQMVFNIVMVLLEDDELLVRNSMSNFASILKIKIALSCSTQTTVYSQRLPIVPEKAREDLLTLATIILQKERAICFLFSWACRHFPDSSNNASEVFERGELNLHAENVPFMEYCGNLLHKLLWTLEDGLRYEDRSIFIEEHALLVTTILLDSLSKYPSPMMLVKTKVSVICALKSTVKFLERYQINNNFMNGFRIYLNDTILGYLTKHVEHVDLYNVKWIIRYIYEPVLKYK
ncbi:thyroid adenoma-associated protein homolog [Leptinotarsa decemlineata]|uniref:thyroid adenoma-associated protein homolog n=1 Tax=Leptinotarsa decemlineata TaxID=7539 RepID=UPI003D30CF04